MKKERTRTAFSAAAPLIFLILVAVIVAVIALNGIYPSGTESLYHLYRGNAVYNALREGRLPGYYDPMWFNGTEPFRFVPPLSAWVLGACQALAGGDVFHGYLLFVGLEFYVSALIWLEIGGKEGRSLLGALLGVGWFFLPYHARILFVEGDLAGSLAITLLPVLFYRAKLFFETRERKSALLLALEVSVLVLTHLELAGMTALALLIWALVRGVVRRESGNVWAMAGTALSGFLLTGLWLTPCLAGGFLKQGGQEQAAAGFQELWLTLDPRRIWVGETAAVYGGLGLFLLLCFAAVLIPKRVRGEGWTALTLVLCTSAAVGGFVMAIPGGQYLRLFRLLPGGAALGFLALLSWGELRRTLAGALCLLVLADGYSSLLFLRGEQTGSLPAEERMETFMEDFLLDRAQEVTRQRLAILDEGNLGGEGRFLTAAYGSPVPISDGDRRAYAVTGDRQRRISRALTKGDYLYVFDRCLELGCDTVLLRRGEVPEEDWQRGLPNRAAERLGYELLETSRGYSLYHLETGSSWGVTAGYEAIGIGETAYQLALSYPAMEETSDPNLNHYTMEELSRYKLVYLSGFTYDDKEQAEKLVLDLSGAGIRVVIDAESVPENRRTRDRSFLGVRSNGIEFSNGYPEIRVDGEEVDTDLFPQGYGTWSTEYMEGLDRVRGVTLDQGLELPIYGTVRNDNIVFLGLGLGRYYFLSGSAHIGELLSQALALEPDRLPQRKLVPLAVEYADGDLVLTTGFDGVNTTLSYQDSFVSEGHIENRNGLLSIDSGTTVISLEYPVLLPGVIFTLAGGMVLLWVLLQSGGKQSAEPPEEAEASEGDTARGEGETG